VAGRISDQGCDGSFEHLVKEWNLVAESLDVFVLGVNPVVIHKRDRACIRAIRGEDKRRMRGNDPLEKLLSAQSDTRAAVLRLCLNIDNNQTLQ